MTGIVERLKSQGSPAQAGVVPDAKEQIDAVCRSWAEDTGEPFVTLVARHGVIVTHEAFGQDAGGQPIDRDYRCWVASITKTVTDVDGGGPTGVVDAAGDVPLVHDVQHLV